MLITKGTIFIMSIPKTTELFDLSYTLAAPILKNTEYPFEALPKIKEFVRTIGPTLGYEEIAPEVWVAPDVKIAPTAVIEGPTVIGAGTEVRPGAFIRGSALIGEGVVVGNSTEIKNAIIFDKVQIPHYNYVGDSILGYRSHMGAGAIASNFKLDHSNISVRSGEEKYDTGLRKFGAILGDFAEVGCNSVMCPGTIIGKESIVYPLSRVRGVIPERSIFDSDGKIRERRL